MNLQESIWCLGNLKLLTTIQHIPFYKLLLELNICTFTYMKKRLHKLQYYLLELNRLYTGLFTQKA